MTERFQTRQPAGGDPYSGQPSDRYQPPEQIAGNASTALTQDYLHTVAGPVARPNAGLVPTLLKGPFGHELTQPAPSAPSGRSPFFTPRSQSMPNGMGVDVIPTLTSGLPADEHNHSVYPANFGFAGVAEQNRDSIVQITGPTRTDPKVADTGSGFFVDRHGDIATAYHVIKDMSIIQVTTSDGKLHEAHVVKASPTTDIAVIAISPGEGALYKPVTLASTSDNLKQGDPLAVLGHPAGWPKLYLSPGTFMARGTYLDVASTSQTGQNPEQNMFQAVMNVQGGDSGSPAFDATGGVVGIADQGDKGKHGWMTSVNDLWPLLDKTARADQANQPQPPGDLPSSLHLNKDSLLTAATAGISALAITRRAPLTVAMGTFGNWMVAASAGTDLLRYDLPFWEQANSTGTMREKVNAGINLAADGLMIGGGLLSTFGKTRPIGVAASLIGTSIKVGNQVAAYRSYS